MLSIFRFAPSFQQACQWTNPVNRSSRPDALSFCATVTALRMMCEALYEGRAAYRQYEHLRSRRIPHDMALRRAIGSGRSSSPAMGDTATRSSARSVVARNRGKARRGIRGPVAGRATELHRGDSRHPVGAMRSEAVRAFIELLKSPSAIGAIKAKGMQLD
jgi:hypothetical protein